MDNNPESVKEKEADKQPEKSETKIEPIVPPAVPKPADADPHSIGGPDPPLSETPSLASLIGDVKIAYEKKIAEITLANAKAIKERDDLIKQLAAGDQPKKQSSIVDEINSRRNWKKW